MKRDSSPPEDRGPPPEANQTDVARRGPVVGQGLEVAQVRVGRRGQKHPARGPRQAHELQVAPGQDPARPQVLHKRVHPVQDGPPSDHTRQPERHAQRVRHLGPRHPLDQPLGRLGAGLEGLLGSPDHREESAQGPKQDEVLLEGLASPHEVPPSETLRLLRRRLARVGALLRQIEAVEDPEERRRGMAALADLVRRAVSKKDRDFLRREDVAGLLSAHPEPTEPS